MEFKGHKNLEELTGLLKGESPRCLVIVAAAFFDEQLKTVLEDNTSQSFAVRIREGLKWGVLTQFEHDDLDVLRELRNQFAHDLRVTDFDNASAGKIARLKLWETAAASAPLERVIKTALDQLLYVVGIIGFRLQHRSKPATPQGPLSEPPFHDKAQWPPVTNI